jgi:hypothetical protein
MNMPTKMKMPLNRILGCLALGMLFSSQLVLRAQTNEYTFITLAGSPGTFGSTDGTGSGARFNQPSGVAVDGVGNVYVADESNGTIRRIGPGGVVTTVAILEDVYSDGFGGTTTIPYRPSGLAVEVALDGSIYVAASDNTIRKISPSGAVTTIAGLAGSPGSADGTGSAARLLVQMA